jgi:hypothetical protein
MLGLLRSHGEHGDFDVIDAGYDCRNSFLRSASGRRLLGLPLWSGRDGRGHERSVLTKTQQPTNVESHRTRFRSTQLPNSKQLPLTIDSKAIDASSVLSSLLCLISDGHDLGCWKIARGVMYQSKNRGAAPCVSRAVVSGTLRRA